MKHIENSDADTRLWEAIVAHEGEIFVTARGLEYRYSVKHNRDGAANGEIVFDRKAKSITRATIFLAWQKALEVQAAEGCVKGPKKLGVFGASYLYPIFLKLGICKGPDDGPRKAAEGTDPLSHTLQNEIREEKQMPRPKGSKNRKKAPVDQPLDALIAEVKEAIAGLEEEKGAVEAVIAENNTKLKAIKADLKKAAKKLEDYEAEQASKAAAEAAAAAKGALQSKIDELVSSGVSVEEILEKLK